MGRLIVNVLAVLAVLGIVAGLIVGAYVFSGRYNLAATQPHLRLVAAALDSVFHRSVRRQAEGLVPPDLGQAEVAQGASVYAANCARCHATPGADQPDWTQGLRPKPPHLGREPTPFDTAEVFWLVRNGARMTGMPAWNGVLDEQETWAVAGFVKAMPDLTPDEVQRMLEEEPGSDAADTGDRQPGATEASPEAGDEAQGETRQAAKAAPAGEEAAASDAQDDGAGDTAADEAQGETPQAAEGAPAGEDTAADDAQDDGSGDAAADEGQDDGAGQAAAVVGMTNSLEFDPPEITIRRGETVLWRNSSDVQHTVTADRSKVSDPQNMALPEGAEPFDSGTLQPGEDWSRTFDVPGRYRYFCIPHEAAGMIGTVVVED